MMSDFALASTQLIWDAPNNPELPVAALVTIPGDDDDRYHASWGACNLEFVEADETHKIALFLAKFIALVVVDGIDPKKLHEVFSQVPEYRQVLADVGGFDPEKV